MLRNSGSGSFHSKEGFPARKSLGDIDRQASSVSVFSNHSQELEDGDPENEIGVVRRKQDLKWGNLIKDYTQNSTMHGIRYITLDTGVIRRLVWGCFVLGVISLFAYVVAMNYIYYLSKPKGVNVEVSYEEMLPFPAVTICNENRYRLSKLYKSGVYDLLVNHERNYSVTGSMDGCEKDKYLFYNDVCSIPDSSSRDGYWTLDVAITTRRGCEELCSLAYTDTCSGFLYERDAMSCKLTAYASLYIPPHPMDCHFSTNEFYRRLRCLHTKRVKCDYEFMGECSLLDEEEFDEKFKVVEARGKMASHDNTLATESGHYLYLAETSSKGKESNSPTAGIKTVFIDTTDKCLSLVYGPLGETPAILEISYVNEDLDVSTVLYSVDPNSFPSITRDWIRAYTPLPAGINQISIRARRSTGGTSGLALDDIEIDTCDTLQRRSCLVDRRGTVYTGDGGSAAPAGVKCSSWGDAWFLGHSLSLLPDNNITASADHCRLVPGFGWEKPSCFDQEQSTLYECNIGYCDCPPEAFRCPSGLCVPSSKLCDGYDDCGDEGDENDYICEEKKSLGCNFEDTFLCGWKSGVDQNSEGFVRHKGPGFSVATSPKTDSMGSKQGHYLYLDSRLGVKGRRTLLQSPEIKSVFIQEFSFSVHMTVLPSQQVAKLELYLADELSLPQYLVWSSIGYAQLGWVKHTVIISPHVHQLIFVATLGASYHSDIALDDFTIQQTYDEFSPHLSDDNTHFLSNHQVHGLSNNAYFNWVSMEKDEVVILSRTIPSVGCSELYSDIDGLILSPGYPLSYPANTSCTYTIASARDSLRLTFDFLDLDYDRDTLSCLDYVLLNGEKFCHPEVNGANTSTWREIQTQSEQFVFVFKSDIAIQRKGFAIRYSIQPLPRPTALVARERQRHQHDGVTPGDMIKLYLRNPGELRCLTISAFINTRLTVDILYKNGPWIFTQPLYASDVGLGEAWHTLKFHDVTPDGPDTTLLLTAYYSGSDTIVALSDITWTPGCLSQSEVIEGGSYCRFVEENTCGWLDRTGPGPRRWMRIYRYKNPATKTGGEYAMHLDLRNGHVEYILQKDIELQQLFQWNPVLFPAGDNSSSEQTNPPPVLVSKETCLGIYYTITRNIETNSNLPTPLDFNPLATNKYYMWIELNAAGDAGVASEMKIFHGHRNYFRVELPTGRVSITLTVAIPEGNIFTEESKYYLQISQINIAEDECGGIKQLVTVSRLSSAACDFTDSRICGYYAENWHDTKRDGNGLVILEGGYRTGKLVSPVLTIDSGTELIIKLKINHGALKLYSIIDGTPEQLLIDSAFHPETEEIIVCLPQGTFSLLFLGELEGSELSEIAIDSVSLDLPCRVFETAAIPRPDSPPPGPGLVSGDPVATGPSPLECSFDIDSCSYIPYAEFPIAWVNLNGGLLLGNSAADMTSGFGYLFSPVFTNEEHFCLEIYVQINAYLKISVKEKYKWPEDLLELEPDAQMLGIENKMNIDVYLNDAGPSQIEFMFLHNSNADSAIHSITSTAGRCEEPSFTNLHYGTCTFSEGDLCGYRQSATTNSVWLRKARGEQSFNLETCVKREHATLVSTLTAVQDHPYYCFTLSGVKASDQVKLVVNLIWEDGMITLEDTNPMFSKDDGAFMMSESGGSPPRFIQISAVPLAQDDTDKCIQIHRIEFRFNSVCTRNEEAHVVDGIPRGNFVADYILGYEQILYDLKRNEVNMKEFEAEQGHQMLDTIHSCTWHGEKCADDTLSVVSTNMGQCFSFNAQSQLETKLTGSTEGLRLVINVENYEYVRNYHQNQGVKVHLHGWKDAENVQNMGFAVAPNDHAFVGMKYTITESLGAPFGNCSSLPLTHYDGSYSKVKCARDCEVYRQNYTCGCVEPYLPGNLSVCDFYDDYYCMKPMMTSDEPEMSRDGEITDACECHENCTIVSYPLELSAGKMSDWNSADVSEVRQNVLTNYQHSREIKHRIDGNSLGKVTGIFTDIIDALDKLSRHLHSSFSVGTSSRFDYVLSAVDSLNELVKHDIYSNLLEDFNEAMIVYNKQIHPFADFTNNQLYSVILDIELLMKLYLKEGVSSQQFTRVSQLKDKIQNLQQGVDVLVDVLEVDQDLLPTAETISGPLHYKACSPSEVIGYRKVMEELDSAIGNITANDDMRWQRLDDRLSAFLTRSHGMSNCFIGYTEFTKKLESWLLSLSFGRYEREFPVLDWINTVKQHRDAVKDMFDAYLGGSKPLLLLAEEIAATTDTHIKGLDKLHHDLTAEITPLLHFLTSKGSDLSDKMLEAFSQLVDLQFYLLKSESLESRAKSSYIWKSPYVDLDSAQVIMMRYDAAYVERIWPRTQGLNSYLQSSGNYQIKQTMRDIMDSLSHQILSDTEYLAIYVQLIKQHFTQLKSYMDKYRIDSEIDQNFMRDNFLKMDVYYGELKYERIQQFEAYDILALFGDIGGYMGLLLGCSLVTVLELLDLIVYNSFRKLVNF